MRLLFVDVETTGLDENYHEIVEIGIIAPGFMFEARLNAEFPERASPKALEVNGYPVGGWPDADPSWLVAKIVHEMTKGAILVGMNVQFDARLLRAFLRKHDLTAAWDYHLLDLFSLTWPYTLRHNLSLGSDTLSKALGLDPEVRPHRALNGARQLKGIYDTFMGLAEENRRPA